MTLMVITPSVSSAFFSENFDQATAPFGPGGIQYGIPVPPEADYDNWHGAQFSGSTSVDPATVIGIQAVGANGNDTPTGVFQSGYGLVFEISTLGMTDVTIEFDYRTVGLLNEFKAGYLVAPSPFAGQNQTADFRGGAYDAANWTLLNPGSTQNEWLSSGALTLPGGEENILIAFWADTLTPEGELNHAKVDNIRVVPEPGTALLFGLGLAGLSLNRRRS